MTTRGFISIAQNTTDVDYARLAYLQRLSCRLTNPDIPYALVVDENTYTDLGNSIKHFDTVIKLPVDFSTDAGWKQKNDWQLFRLSPFRENIKLECDLLFTHNIDHWWRMLRTRPMVISVGCRDWRGNRCTSRQYRKIFDLNHLPDVYSGLMYWRYTGEAAEYFRLLQRLSEHWDEVATQLEACDDPGSNDMIHAVAVSMIGEKLTTLPAADFFMFTHMKSAVQALPNTKPWHEACNVETTIPGIRINGIDQMSPFHYYEKAWPTDKLIQEYQDAVDRN